MIQRIQNDEHQSLHFSMYLGLSSIRANQRHDQSDHYDRIRNQIRLLQKENESLKSELSELQKNPSQVIRNFQANLMRRISQLRQQNEGIELLIQKSKMPGYCEMTKKKPHFVSETPGKEFKRDDAFGQQRGTLLPQLQFSEKCEMSTCQNFPIQHNISQNPLRPLQPLQEYQLQVRAQITSQLLQIIDRSTQITQEIDKIAKQKHEPQKKLKMISQNKGKFDEIAKYKQRLILLLKKLKTREQNQEKIIRQYRKLHEQTYLKFKQATELLSQISCGKNMETNGENIDDLYAEALQLEEKLKYINEQLERLDENQWLKDIHSQLILALKRLSIQPPDQKAAANTQQLKQRIDQLADILIECIANHKADEKQKLILLKHYYDEQKENNKKIIKSLQNKEQGLSKKLIDMQLNC